MLRKIVILSIIITLVSCENKSKTELEIEKIPVIVNVVRFDQKFADATPEGLPELKKDFPYLFPGNIPDSVWVAKIKDTLQQALNREVDRAFPTFQSEKDEIYQLFQHLKYYFPKFSEPKIVTLTSGVDYQNRVIVTDSLLLISLDVYLGKDHKFYEGIYPYLRADFEPKFMASDIAGEYAKKFVPKLTGRSFLNKMVYYGKILYLKELLLPFNSDAQKLGYTNEQMKWANNNEDEIWRYFVEKELLFSTDDNLGERFIEVAPYSKFYLKLDNESPPQLGRFVGWKIVKQFVEKNGEVSLKELLSTDAKTIFEKSNYKPEKA